MSEQTLQRPAPENRLWLLPGWAHGNDHYAPLLDALGGPEVRAIDWHMLGPHRATWPRLGLEQIETTRHPVTLLGWSLGALLALDIAARAPDRIAGLILLSATARFVSDADETLGIPTHRLRAMRKGLARHPETVLRAFFKEVLVPEEADPAMVDTRIEKALRIPCETLQAGLDYLAEADTREALSAIRAPVLLFHGREDRIVPIGAGQRLALALPRTVCTYYDHTGHDLPFYRARRVAQVIRSLQDEKGA